MKQNPVDDTSIENAVESSQNKPKEYKDFGELLMAVSSDLAVLFIQERIKAGAKIQIMTSDGKSNEKSSSD
jgi:hypothetical protein